MNRILATERAVILYLRFGECVCFCLVFFCLCVVEVNILRCCSVFSIIYTVDVQSFIEEEIHKMLGFTWILGAAKYTDSIPLLAALRHNGLVQ